MRDRALASVCLPCMEKGEVDERARRRASRPKEASPLELVLRGRIARKEKKR